ncbi:MAG: hypothetical protein WBA74_19215 [Cyclobacteriaceae bacterium]
MALILGLRKSLQPSIIFLIILIQSTVALSQENVSFLSKDNKILEVRILSKKNNHNISVRSENSRTDILGNWSYEEDIHTFRPLIPLSSGRKYYIFQNSILTDSIFLAKAENIIPKVTAFYPTSDTVPANLLKCYIEFSVPMSEIAIYDHIVVKDENGKELNDIILPLKPALWNKNNTLLTLWIDPGRVKRDLIRNKLLGSPLSEGKRYTVTIQKTLRSASGSNPDSDFEKTFYVTKRDEKIPDPQCWTVLAPEKLSVAPLSIHFNESLDYLTSLTGISVYEGEVQVKGTVLLSDNEQIWQFIPDKAWSDGEYFIRLAPYIEDLAGNNLDRPFDRDVYKTEEVSANQKEISFTIH